VANDINEVRRGGDLSFGARGRSVGDVQRRLIELGFLPREHQGRSNADNKFGFRTQQALIDFQSANRLIDDPSDPNAGRMTPATYDKLFLPGPVVSAMNQAIGNMDMPAERQRIQNRIEEQARDRYSIRPPIQPQPLTQVEADAMRAQQELQRRPWTENDLGLRGRPERIAFGRERLGQLEARLITRSPAMTPDSLRQAQQAITALRRQYDELESWWWSTPSQRRTAATQTNQLEREVARSTDAGRL
jgi:peptidoglycan hydrolase-like protein with peptidoglycan-binding domain